MGLLFERHQTKNSILFYLRKRTNLFQSRENIAEMSLKETYRMLIDTQQ